MKNLLINTIAILLILTETLVSGLVDYHNFTIIVTDFHRYNHHLQNHYTSEKALVEKYINAFLALNVYIKVTVYFMIATVVSLFTTVLISVTVVSVFVAYLVVFNNRMYVTSLAAGNASMQANSHSRVETVDGVEVLILDKPETSGLEVGYAYATDRVYISEALFAENEGVLYHEIGHVKNGDILRKFNTGIFGVILCAVAAVVALAISGTAVALASAVICYGLGYVYTAHVSRECEYNADAYAKAKVGTVTLVKFLRRYSSVAKPVLTMAALTESHPCSYNRIQRLK